MEAHIGHMSIAIRGCAEFQHAWCGYVDWKKACRSTGTGTLMCLDLRELRFVLVLVAVSVPVVVGVKRWPDGRSYCGGLRKKDGA